MGHCAEAVVHDCTIHQPGAPSGQEVVYVPKKGVEGRGAVGRFREDEDAASVLGWQEAYGRELAISTHEKMLAKMEPLNSLQLRTGMNTSKQLCGDH